MFDLATRLGVQSYCFRGFKPLPDLLAQIQSIGVSHLELCGVHVDFSNEASFESVIDQCRAAGITISSIGVQTFRGNPIEESWFRFCKASGARLIATNFDLKAAPTAIALAEKLAEKYDLFLGIHNHGGYHWLGSLDMLTHTLSQSGPRLGLCLDTAWAMQTGEDALKFAEKLHPKLFGIHVKDFTFDRAAKWTDVVVGTGNLKLKETLALATSAPHMQAITLEYEGDVQNPAPALRDGVKAVRNAT